MEDTLTLANKVSIYIRKPVTQLTASAVFGVATGFGFGYLVANRRSKRLIDLHVEEVRRVEAERQVLADERAEVDRRFHESIANASKVADDLRNLGMDVLTNLEGLKIGEEIEISVDRVVQPEDPDAITNDDDVDAMITEMEDAGVVRNIFANTPGWDMEFELSNRSGDKPYVIHVDEFASDEMGWDSQSTLTWYEKDQILADSQDVAIANPERLIGPIRFGHGSNDPNTFYVRNEKLRAEYEILRVEGSFQEIVLGETLSNTELRHSRHQSRMRRWDQDD